MNKIWGEFLNSDPYCIQATLGQGTLHRRPFHQEGCLLSTAVARGWLHPSWPQSISKVGPLENPQENLQENPQDTIVFTCKNMEGSCRCSLHFWEPIIDSNLYVWKFWTLCLCVGVCVCVCPSFACHRWALEHTGASINQANERIRSFSFSTTSKQTNKCRPASTPLKHGQGARLTRKWI